MLALSLASCGVRNNRLQVPPRVALHKLRWAQKDRVLMHLSLADAVLNLCCIVVHDNRLQVRPRVALHILHCVVGFTN